MRRAGVRRSGDRDPHRAVRDGVPHADLGAGADGSFERAGTACSRCTGRIRASPARMRRNCLLARRLAERDVRFVQLYKRGWDQHNDLPRDLALQCQERRPAVGGAGAGFETARAARRHAGHLGRRIRPHRLLPGQADGRPTTAATTIRAVSPCGWRAAASSAGSRYRRDGRLLLQRRVAIRCTSTICRPRSCICLGMDHKRLTYQFQGRAFPADGRRGRGDEEDAGVRKTTRRPP